MKIHNMPYLRNSIAYEHDFCYTFVKWWYLWAFFHFFKILIFWVVSGVKRQKMAQNDKKSCLLRSISQEPYIIWLPFVIHKCKMIIYPVCFFSIFQHLDFVVRRVKRQKNGLKWQKTLSVSLRISGTTYDCGFWYTYVKWWYL